MLVPHKITALEQSNDPNVNALNTVVGAVVSLLDLQGQAVLLYDDEAGLNPSTAKTTDSSGQVVVWVAAGEYDEAVNGSTLRRVLVGNKGLTTEQLINRTRKALDGDVTTTTGFSVAGDSGSAQWRATSTTGLTPSQTPVDRDAAELVDGNGRLWELIREKRVTPYQLGAKGNNNDDDAAAIKVWLSMAGDLYAPDGDFVIDNQGADTDGVLIDLVRSTSVTCSNKARFVARNGLDGDLLRFEVRNSGTLEDVLFTWRGGVIDQRDQANSTVVPFSDNYPPQNVGTTATSDGLSVRGVYNDGGTLKQGVKSCHIDSVMFIASDSNWQAAGGDSGANLATANGKVTNCTFIGHRDLGVYHSSDDNGLGLGESFICSGNSFKRCMFGVTSKRGSDNITISGNTFKDCIQWISTEPFSNRASSVSITGNVGSGYVFGVDLYSTDEATVTGNVFKNAGILLNGDILPTVNFDNPQAITLRGVLNSTVTSNTISGKIPEYSVYSCEGVVLTDANSIDSDGNLIASNIINDINQPVTGSLLNNSFELNKVSGTNDDDFGSKEITTTQLIDRSGDSQTGDVITTTGFATAGEGGAQWKATSTTGLTPSQTPDDRGAAELVDGDGRLWEISENEYITPDMLGAVGDGVTDDTNVFQAAINSARKCPVIIPQKSYAVTTLDIKDREITGLGGDSELVQIGAASYLITSSGSRAATTLLTSDAAAQSDTVSVADSSIFSVGDYAILSDELEYNPLDSSYKNGEMHRIKSVSSGTVTFEYEIMGGIGETNYTTSNASRLVLANPQQSPKIKNLKISGDVSSSTSIVLFDVCKSPVVERVTFNKGGYYGVRFNSCIDGVVKDSVFEGFLDDPGHVGYCVLASNATNGLNITGNTFGKCRHAFTTVGGSDGSPANIIIEGNVAKGTLQAAYDTHVSGKHIIIEGNISYNSKGSGINCRSPHTEIFNNEVISPSVHGISLSESLNADVRIEGNTISRASQLGISAGVLADKVSIKNNVIDRAGLDGIRYGSTSARTSVVGNVITDAGEGNTGRAAILCVASSGTPASDSVIEGNIINGSSSNLNYGISNSITSTVVKDNVLQGSYALSSVNVIGSSKVKGNIGYELSGFTKDTGVPLDTIGVLSRSVVNPLGILFDTGKIALTVVASSTNSFELGWIRVLSVTASTINYAINITEEEAGGTIDVGIIIQE